MVVHAHSVARAIENRDWLLDMLDRLTDAHEDRLGTVRGLKEETSDEAELMAALVLTAIDADTPRAIVTDSLASTAVADRSTPTVRLQVRFEQGASIPLRKHRPRCDASSTSWSSSSRPTTSSGADGRPTRR